ncbi:MAG: hypothetical protein KGI89_17320, partial [Euryarchaeota archaeon]|nr:hypothetical protein [Euryarchaeota archaeon]
SDFVGGLITVGLPNDRPTTGDVIFGNYTGMGVNSVVMPGQNVPEGVAIGALSFVPGHFPFEPWTIYAGNPIRKIRERDKESVMRQLRDVEG